MKVRALLRPEPNRRIFAAAWILAWLGIGIFLWVQWKELNPLLKWALVAVDIFFCPDTKMIAFVLGRSRD
jgi:hypothetical protein